MTSLFLNHPRKGGMLLCFGGTCDNFLRKSLTIKNTNIDSIYSYINVPLHEDDVTAAADKLPQLDLAEENALS
jgi:hypothetical protein